MRKGPRLLLDILISAVFAIFFAVLGLLVGVVLFIIVGLVFFRGRSDDAVGVICIFLMFLCGLIFGVPVSLCAASGWINGVKRQDRGIPNPRQLAVSAPVDTISSITRDHQIHDLSSPFPKPAPSGIISV